MCVAQIVIFALLVSVASAQVQIAWPAPIGQTIVRSSRVGGNFAYSIQQPAYAAAAPPMVSAPPLQYAAPYYPAFQFGAPSYYPYQPAMGGFPFPMAPFQQPAAAAAVPVAADNSEINGSDDAIIVEAAS